jgi:hypothetical protein
MPTKVDFDPTQPLPRFLADQAEPGIGNAPDRAVAPSRVFKASILIAAVTATGIGILALGNPAALLAQMSASLVGNSSPQPTPAIQSAADTPAPSNAAVAQAVPPATRDAPARDELAAPEPAAKDLTEQSEPSSETLFAQFQAWAAEQDAQTRSGLVQPVQNPPARVVQNGPAPAAENVRTPYRLVQKRRQIRAVRNARAEVRTQNLRKQVRGTQGARAERPPVQDARAQAPSVQNAEAPSFLGILGPRN